MNIIRIDTNNQVNGDGLRCVVWVSGCENYCPQCHNPETWDYKCGHAIDKDDWDIIVDQLKKPEISGITISGGDPFAPKNRKDTRDMCNKIKKLFPYKTIWVYTGHSFEEIQDYVKDVDVLIDGKYDYTLNPGVGACKWRGSTNQRIIDIPETLKQNTIVQHKSFMDS